MNYLDYLKRKIRRQRLLTALVFFLGVIAFVSSILMPDSPANLVAKVQLMSKRLAAARHENSDLRETLAAIMPPCMQKETFIVTAYESSPRSTGKWAQFNLTKSGTTPAKLRTIAVDPSVIRLGALCYLKGWGWAVAEDTGSAIKGKRIDIYLDSVEEAVNFGVKEITVYYPDEQCIDTYISHAKYDRKVDLVALYPERKDTDSN